MRVGQKVASIAERLGEIFSEISIEDRGYETECWIYPIVWKSGYAAFSRRADLDKPRDNHNFIYSVLVEYVPEGHVVDHLCRQRACINITHMEVVTIGENISRSPANAKDRPTHCLKGHELTIRNTYRNSGKRACRVCGIERDRIRQSKLRATRYYMSRLNEILSRGN